MNASPKSHFMPWVWFGVICLLAANLAIGVCRLREEPAFGVGLLLFVGLPALMGYIGGRHGKWAITLGGVPAIVVATAIGIYIRNQSQGRIGGPPELGSLTMTTAAMSVIATLTHAIGWLFRPLSLYPGHCRGCGQDLGFCVDRPCPACGEPVLCLHCGYNLTGNDSGICPECKTPVPTSPKAV